MRRICIYFQVDLVFFKLYSKFFINHPLLLCFKCLLLSLPLLLQVIELNNTIYSYCFHNSYFVRTSEVSGTLQQAEKVHCPSPNLSSHSINRDILFNKCSVNGMPRANATHGSLIASCPGCDSAPKSYF